MVMIGDTFPNFSASTTVGSIKFHEWLGNSWGILFSHPYDFTPICTTELTRVVTLMPEFDRLGVKVIGLSCDPVETHAEWIEDIKCNAQMTKDGFPYPIIDDKSRKISKELGMLDAQECDHNCLPLAVRAVSIVDPRKIMRLSISYPVTVGRNFNEIIRVIESLQLFDQHSLGTPVDWKKGDDCLIHLMLSQEEAEKLYGNQMKITSLPSKKLYLRTVPYPKHCSSTVKLRKNTVTFC